MESLDRLRLRQFVEFGHIEKRASDFLSLRLWKRGLIPTPHPLDFNWWFDGDSLKFLLEYMNGGAQPGQEVVMLGTPTLFQAALLAGPKHRLTLLDRDAAAISYCNGATALCVDLARDQLPKLSAQLVIADPPWYEEEMKAFLWAARQLAAVGARVIMSVPPRGTRPGVLEEWKGIINWARILGLTFERLELARVGYYSPMFERNALNACAVPLPTENWRRGDLATFRCERVNRAKRPIVKYSEYWEERVISTVRIRVRIRGDNESWDPKLKPIIHGDILPTVSRRDPVRDSIDVWTSANRVFRCDGVRALLSILDALGSGGDPLTRVQQDFQLGRRHGTGIRHAAAQIAKLIKAEQRELARYAD
ncbi:MAG TPA: hypothetical protein VGG03_22230 [Thermoanaerobaculia bacterium]|jgi:hypothetical protein